MSPSIIAVRISLACVVHAALAAFLFSQEAKDPHVAEAVEESQRQIRQAASSFRNQIGIRDKVQFKSLIQPQGRARNQAAIGERGAQRQADDSGCGSLE